MTDFKMVPIRDIRPDPNQPRKIYDETAMAELTASVKEKGVLQPILLRPNGKGMMLVCGERRYRASKEAGLEEIPAVIRTLTDDEALELQIIENLQRKDVNPMEEGSAFQVLHNKFSIEEIALRVGKTPQYVAMRMKLCDLIPGFQELVFAGRMKLILAQQMARLTEKDQQLLYREARVPKDWAKKKDWEIPSWIRVDQHEHNLDEAPFKTEDADLYPEMGACNKCSHNSNFNKLLFPDLQRKRICHNGTCYSLKSSKTYQRTIEKAAADPDLLFVSMSWYVDKESNQKIKAAEELGVQVIPHDLIDDEDEPEKTYSWSDFLEEQKDDSDFEEMTVPEQKKMLALWKKEHAELMSEYEKDLAEFKELQASGVFRKAFVVCGTGEGKIINIRFKTKSGVAKQNATAGDTLATGMVEVEMAEMKAREARNKELDREKVYKRLLELLKPEGNDFLTNTADLSPDEWAGLLFALCDNSFAVRNFIDEQLNIKDGYEGKKRYDAICKNQDAGILVRSMRLFIHDKLINKNECDYAKRGKAAAIYEIGKQYFQKELATFELEQTEKATRRAVTVKARLKALEDKRKELLAKEPAPAPPKKSSKKAKA